VARPPTAAAAAIGRVAKALLYRGSRRSLAAGGLFPDRR